MTTKIGMRLEDITKVIVEAGEKARRETSGEPEPELTKPLKWPIDCVVGPGLEGAISCETKIGYVNGKKGCLVYRGYDIFDLCAYSTFEEVSYLLLHGNLPTEAQLEKFNKKLVQYRDIVSTQRLLMGFPIEKMNPMAALRLGTNLMRRELTPLDDKLGGEGHIARVISSDEDSIPMETVPRGEEKAIYEFKAAHKGGKKPSEIDQDAGSAVDMESCCHLISGVAGITATIARLREGKLPLAPDGRLGHAANFLYMMTGRRPSPVETRIMDVALILHADHGMNASTFASMVVASTLSDIYFSVGSGIAALNGALHGGANEQVLHMLKEIGGPDNVAAWLKRQIEEKKKVMGFGHRVYKAYDPRARVLGPLAGYLGKDDKEKSALFATAKKLEEEFVSSVGDKKKIFPNVDFYSGIVYSCMDIPSELFTPIFAVSRVAGWTARVREYLKNNRIFRPRAMYVGEFGKKYEPIEKRGSTE